MKLKTAAEIKILAEGGQKLAAILRALAALCRPGMNAAELDSRAEAMIRAAGGEPSFKGFGAPGREFPGTLCVSPNDMVVHGIPHPDLVFKAGDLIGIDIGMKYQGLYTDHALTVPIGRVSPAAQKLLDVTEECLKLGIAAARVGNKLGDIGCAVQTYAEKHGFGVVRKLTGHGVGYDVHEEPRVYNFGEPGRGEPIAAGLVLAIEPMINIGTPEVKTADDGWGVVTTDGSLSAHFEHTVAITKNGPIILTI